MARDHLYLPLVCKVQGNLPGATMARQHLPVPFETSRTMLLLPCFPKLKRTHSGHVVISVHHNQRTLRAQPLLSNLHRRLPLQCGPPQHLLRCT